MVYIDSQSCNGCGLCLEACPQGAISLVDDVAVIDPELCQDTGRCLEVCPQGAVLQVTEPEVKQAHAPVPVRTSAAAKPSPAPLFRPSPRAGSWVGAALGYLVSEVVPEVFRYWLDRRRDRPPAGSPGGRDRLEHGRGCGKGKLRRRRRIGRRC